MTLTKYWEYSMDVLLNELSLEGQYPNTEVFLQTGLMSVIGVLREMQSFDTTLLKKSDVWSRMVTQGQTLHSLLTGPLSRSADEIRRLKISIANLQNDPYWDDDSRQPQDTSYIFNGQSIVGTSPAEACERERIILSFLSSAFSVNPFCVIRNNLPIKLYNRKFEQLDWNQIHIDKGLDYKEFQNTLGAAYSGKRTYKFRTSRKFRCHGYRQNERFVVIGFETDHDLSDRG
jgi:hypothetical protein